ncbi:hypothetical protein GIB67_030020 [Kingdonia uniflora]|uniref:Radical SAM core domain-containing protein n=1 Tax=Kingdonia uniflora TaxID=39325 RepID=A0A7J7MYB8_9MAGN|nr:hypothetical protein GIB67_030020 [Kingdonia uniflora]
MEKSSIFDFGKVRAEFNNAGINTHFIPLIWKHVLQNPNCELDQVPSLPSAARTILKSKFRPLTTSIHSVIESLDNVTTKLLVKLQILGSSIPPLEQGLSFKGTYNGYVGDWNNGNGAFVEAVIMRYDSSLGTYAGKPRSGGPRATLCISSQVGCKMGCTFCATGSMGFKNNLSSGEVVEQLVHASRLCQIRNIVFMGMGEPMNNYSSVVEAVQCMTRFPFQISPKRITVSTVGIIHAINKLYDDLPNVNLAVSLHAPVQEIRCQIMPAARAFPLQRLMDSLHVYQKKSQQKIFIEYIMLDGVNDEEQHAHQLGKLLEMMQVVVNLIPFNPIGDLSRFKTSDDGSVVKFQKILRGMYNIRTTVRKQMGQDISGACGQLVVNLPKKGSSGCLVPVTDIEDLRI